MINWLVEKEEIPRWLLLLFITPPIFKMVFGVDSVLQLIKLLIN